MPYFSERKPLNTLPNKFVYPFQVLWGKARVEFDAKNVKNVKNKNCFDQNSFPMSSDFSLEESTPVKLYTSIPTQC